MRSYSKYPNVGYFWYRYLKYLIWGTKWGTSSGPPPPIIPRPQNASRWYCIILFFLETGFTFTSISPPVHSAQAAAPAHYAARFHSIFICFNLFQYVWIRSNPFQSVSICLNTFQSCLMMSSTVSMVKYLIQLRAQHIISILWSLLHVERLNLILHRIKSMLQLR